jgi:hypothetical protein
MPDEVKPLPRIYFEDICGFLYAYVIGLPLTLTMDRESRWIRLLGILWFLVWFLPIGTIWLPLFTISLLGMLVESAWKE